MEFSEKLKKLRAEKGISQAKLAEDIHISRSAVAKWENGLGLPNDASLQLLSEYFNIDPQDLLSDKQNSEALITKNKTINRQKNIIIGLLVGSGSGLFLLGYLLIEPLRQSYDLLGLGIILVILGIFNMKGNIASIHWYNRRKVTKENQKAYCLVMGLGTTIIGAGLIIAGVTQVFWGEVVGSFVILAGLLIGLSLMLYAQIKYNRGIF